MLGGWVCATLKQECNMMVEGKMVVESMIFSSLAMADGTWIIYTEE
jgi:hypothetical protein